MMEAIITSETSVNFYKIHGATSEKIILNENVVPAPSQSSVVKAESLKSHEKRPLGRPTRKWEDNNKMDLRKIGCEEGSWMELVHAQ
jgi:hypothetical protein